MNPEHAHYWMEQLARADVSSRPMPDAEWVWAKAKLQAEIDARRQAESPLELMWLITRTVAATALVVAAALYLP